MIADVDDTNGLALAQSINASSALQRAIFVHCDVSDPTSIKAAFEAALHAFDAIHVRHRIATECRWL